MFRKDFKVKTNIKAKNSEKRKFISDVSNYYRIDHLSLNNFIGKSDLHKIKAECHDGSIVTIYNFDDQPLFFEVNKVIIPSVYCLWILYSMLPSFTIFEETVAFINNGSDLMIPGILVKKPLNEKSYGTFKKRDLYTINTNVNRAPVALGLTNMDAYDMFMTGGRGKALNILHVQGDYLWAFGKRNLRPEINWEEGNLILTENENIKCKEDTVEFEEDNKSEDEVNEIGDELRNISLLNTKCNASPQDETFDMNERLETCFMHAIKCSLKDKNLPISLNMFYANHVLRFCPDGGTVEIKKTSYKKFGIFMKIMEEKGIVKLKSISKGVDAIDSVNRIHEKLKFTPTLIYQEEKANLSSEAEYAFPKIDEIYFVTDKVHSIFKYYGYKKSDIISPKEIKSIVTEYVTKNNLNGLNKDMVILDDLLRVCCLNSKETITELSWKTLFERINKNMTPGLVMRFPNDNNVILKNSKKPKIKIQSFNRNNKMVTRIEGEGQFCIDSKKLCFNIQQSVGCSCGIVADKCGVLAIQAQGDQRQRVTEILTEHFKVPLNYIEGAVTKKSK